MPTHVTCGRVQRPPAPPPAGSRMRGEGTRGSSWASASPLLESVTCGRVPPFRGSGRFMEAGIPPRVVRLCLHEQFADYPSPRQVQGRTGSAPCAGIRTFRLQSPTPDPAPAAAGAGNPDKGGVRGRLRRPRTPPCKKKRPLPRRLCGGEGGWGDGAPPLELLGHASGATCPPLQGMPQGDVATVREAACTPGLALGPPWRLGRPEPLADGGASVL